MTALDPWQAQLGDNGLLLSNDTGYRIKTIEGLDRAVRSGDTDRANGDGSVLAPDWADAKTVTLTMTIEGADWDPADAMAKYDALAADWNSTRRSENVHATADLRFRLPGRATQRFLGGRPRRLGTDFSTLALGWLEVIATYYAPDPRIVSDELHIVDLAIAAGSATIPNAGNHPAAVMWDVYGAITDPGVIRSETARFDLSGTIANGTFFRVRTDQKTVTRSSDSANRYQDISGTWLEVPAGGALFRAVGNDPSGAAKVRATYRDCWL